MSGAGPELSVVIPTFARAPLLRRALEGLCRQTLRVGLFEVLVVDDGSRDSTRRTTLEFASRLPLRYVFQRNSGLSAAKNLGLFMARAPLLIYLDDDDVAEPDLLAIHLAAHRRHPGKEIAILGHTRLDASLASDPVMHYATEIGCNLFSYPHLREGQTYGFAEFWGGRTSMKRGLLIEHGCFDPAFHVANEDIELGFRLSRHGLRVLYEPRAVSTMIRGLDFDGLVRRCIGQGRARGLLCGLHGDPVVRRWAQAGLAEAWWRENGPRYDALVASARHLDTLVRTRAATGLPPLPEADKYLWRSYESAFLGSQHKGYIEQMAAPSSVGPAVGA